MAARAAGAELVLCMSIEPGYSGQEFLPGSLERIALTRELLPPEVHVQVDGEIDAENIRAVYDAGATLLGIVSHRSPGDVLMGLPFYFCALLQGLGTLLAIRHFRQRRSLRHATT